MKLSEYISRVKRQLPQATGETIDDTTITLELNSACDYINALIMCYKGYTDFTATAEIGIYSLSEKCPNYLGMIKNGVWWYDTDGISHYLYPKTKRWLDIYIRNWRDMSSVEQPIWVYHQEDELGLYPKPSVAGTIRVYHLMKATPMSSGDNYPWKNLTTEQVSLRVLDNAIVNYAVWKLAPAVMDKEGRNTNKQEFFEELKRASAQLKRQPDLTSDYDYFIRPDVTPGILPRY